MTVEAATILLGLPIMRSKEWVFYKELVCKGATSAPNIKKKRLHRYWYSIMAGDRRSIDWIINLWSGNAENIHNGWTNWSIYRVFFALGARGGFYKTGLLYRARSIDRRIPTLEYME